MTIPARAAALLFDFDGVIVESARIRSDGFRAIFRGEPPELVEQLLEYHAANGGISRYAKIRWFYETLKGEPASEATVARLAEQFKNIMLARMTDPAILEPTAVAFLRACAGVIPMHVCSGSDEHELRTVCPALGISQYFVSLHGSPTPKVELVRQVMTEYGYAPSSTIFIGDAINDYEAANASGLAFLGRNNESLRGIGDGYVDDFGALASALLLRHEPRGAAVVPDGR